MWPAPKSWEEINIFQKWKIFEFMISHVRYLCWRKVAGNGMTIWKSFDHKKRKLCQFYKMHISHIFSHFVYTHTSRLESCCSLTPENLIWIWYKQHENAMACSGKGKFLTFPLEISPFAFGRFSNRNPCWFTKENSVYSRMDN